VARAGGGFEGAYRLESVAPGYDERKTPLRDLHVKLIMYRDAGAVAEMPNSTKKRRTSFRQRAPHVLRRLG
jgi:hypothetical protein